MPQDQMQAAELLRSKRDKLNKLPPEVRTKVLGLFFNRTVLPKLKASGLTKEELGIAQDRWQKGIMGEKQEPLPKEFGQRKEATSGLDTMEAFGAGGMSSLYGMMANLLRTYRKLPGEGPPTTGVNQFLDQAVKDWEQKYSQYKQRAGELDSPKAAAAGGLIAGTALSIPAGELGSELVPGALASKLPTIGSALKGAAGGATMAPLYTSDPQEIKRWAEIGGVGGAVLGKAADWIKGLKSSRAQRIATRTAKVVQKEEGPKAVETLATDYDQVAQKKFGKNLADLTTQQQEELVNDVHQQKVAEKKGKGAKTPKTPTLTEGPGSPQWRRQQYIKLRSLGFDVKKGSPIYQSVHEGKSADDIIGTMKAAGVMASEEQPAVKKAVEGVAKTAPEGAPPEEAPKITEKPAEKPGEPPVKVIPPGVSGVSESHKKLLDRYAEVQGKISNPKVSPLAKEKLKKTAENIKQALSGDEEATRRLAESEKTAQRRAAAAAEQTGQATGIEGGEKGAPGQVVKTTGEETPTVELVDSLKGLNFPGEDTQKLYKVLEGTRKAGVSDATMRELADSAYRQLGNKLGIEDADEMPLEELYKRITSLGGQEEPPIQKMLMSQFPQSTKTTPELMNNIKDFANTVGFHAMLTTDQLRGAAGINVGATWYKSLEKTFGDKAPEKFLSAMESMGIERKQAKSLLNLVRRGLEVGFTKSDDPAVWVHEITHTLSNKLGVDPNTYAPANVVVNLLREINDPVYTQDIEALQWISRSPEAYTEALTQYFMRDYNKSIGKPYVKEGSFIFNLAEHMLNVDNPKIRSLIGKALGAAIVATGAYKEVSGGRTSTDGTS